MCKVCSCAVNPADADKYLNKLLIARTAQGSLQFVGRCVSFCDAPTVTAITADGDTVSWRADLCEIVALPDDVVERLKLGAR